MAPRRLIPLAAALAVALTPAAPAGAQSGGGITIDPNSPPGKEYAIPLESARRNATKGSDTLESTQQGDRSAPLFGEGVGASSGAGGSRSGGPRSSEEQSQRSSRRSSGGAVQHAIAGTRTVRATVPAGGVGSVLTIGAVALSVLLLGGVLGSIARRRSA